MLASAVPWVRGEGFDNVTCFTPGGAANFVPVDASRSIMVGGARFDRVVLHLANLIRSNTMPSRNRVLLVLALVGVLALMSASAVFALGDEPEAPIINDEGGPVVITGSVAYTNSFFTAGVAEPLVILEDQAGFVDRNEHFLMPPASQTLGQITSDFYTSPFTYSVALPIEPQGTLRDVDHDGAQETGVMVFAVAYWTNTFGDPSLEERDLYGG